MAYDTGKLSKLGALKALAEKVKSDYALKATVTNLESRINEIVSTGGEPNTINKILVNGTEQTIGADKSVNLIVPIKVSELTNDKKFQTDTEVAALIAAADHMKRKIVDTTSDIDLTAADASQYIYMVKKGTSKTADKYDEYLVLNGTLEKIGDWEVDLSNYVQKEAGKGLSSNDFTTELLTKLNGIDDGANKYVHPSHGAHESGFYKVTIDDEGHVTAVVAVTKEDITALGIPGQDTTYEDATSASHGLMSAEDKAKLDGMIIATDAEITEMLNEVFTTTE